MVGSSPRTRGTRLGALGLAPNRRFIPNELLTLLRSAQEGVTNALRHAAAGRLCIRLDREAEALCLRVEDDGRGPGQSGPGNGLTGLAERLAAVGGSLHFGARPAGGSVLTARVPA